MSSYPPVERCDVLSKQQGGFPVLFVIQTRQSLLLRNCRTETNKFSERLKGVFAKNERGYKLNAIKSAFDRY